VEALSHVTWLHLVLLDLAENSVSPAGARALATCSSQGRLPSLQRLYLCRNRLGNEGVALLCELGSWEQLQALSLVSNGFDAAGMAKLAAAGSSGLEALASLGVSGNAVGDQGAAALGAAAGFPRLAKLHMAGCSIGRRGCEALAAACWAGLVTTLVISGNAGCGDALARVVARGCFPVLQTVNAADTGLTPEAAAVMLSAPAHLQRLQKLDCSNSSAARGSSLGDKGLLAMAALQLPCLQKLYLNGAGIGDAGAIALSTAPWACQITVREAPAGAGLLLAGGRAALWSPLPCTRPCPCCGALLPPQLQVLSLQNNSISALGAAAMARGSLQRVEVLGWAENSELGLEGEHSARRGQLAWGALRWLWAWWSSLHAWVAREQPAGLCACIATDDLLLVSCCVCRHACQLNAVPTERPSTQCFGHATPCRRCRHRSRQLPIPAEAVPVGLQHR
jgi:hypothetical protein